MPRIPAGSTAGGKGIDENAIYLKIDKNTVERSSIIFIRCKCKKLCLLASIWMSGRKFDHE
jgi:hypothetical protein